MFWQQKSSEGKIWKYRDLDEVENWRNIRTRLYFSSASHMYSLMNILTLGNNKYLLGKTPP
jgi:inositol hexakisphosphate/diphosphoinositol-pentakisphosphate kinase